jgi:hypothetical protein
MGCTADGLAAEIVAVLRGAGARFALLHASRAAGSAQRGF